MNTDKIQKATCLRLYENLTIEDDNNIAIRAEQWLISTLEIDDAQASRAQRDVLRAKSSLIVRPPVRKGF